MEDCWTKVLRNRTYTSRLVAPKHPSFVLTLPHSESVTTRTRLGFLTQTQETSPSLHSSLWYRTETHPRYWCALLLSYGGGYLPVVYRRLILFVERGRMFLTVVTLLLSWRGNWGYNRNGDTCDRTWSSYLFVRPSQDSVTFPRDHWETSIHTLTRTLLTYNTPLTVGADVFDTPLHTYTHLYVYVKKGPDLPCTLFLVPVDPTTYTVSDIGVRPRGPDPSETTVQLDHNQGYSRKPICTLPGVTDSFFLFLW